jgi:hypothetical protein
VEEWSKRLDPLPVQPGEQGVELVERERRRSNGLSAEAAGGVPTVPVTVVTSRTEAELIVGFLRSYDVTATVSADDAGGQDPALQVQGVRVLVAPSDEASARQLLAAADDIDSKAANNPTTFHDG